MQEQEQNTGSAEMGSSTFQHLISKRKKGFRRHALLFWALMGPGLLAMIGDNDAGGVLEYVITGAHFGIGLFIPLVACLALITFTVQELTVRMCAVTQKGFTKLIFEHFGRGWGFYHIFSLFFENLFTLMTEFIGMTAGLVLLGIPLWLSTLLSLLLVISVAIFTGYWTKERLALFVGALNLVFVVVTFITRPSMSDIGHAFASWNVPELLQGSLIWYIVATIGNAVAPWMIFFQGSAIIDKGITAKDLRLARIDTLVGSVCQVFIAICCILIGASLFGQAEILNEDNPSTIIMALHDLFGPWASSLFGFGLFNAGFLAAITISLSSSWTFAEAFNWKHSLNNKIKEAPKFYLVYIGSLVLAALLILIPNLPLNFIAVLTQAIGGMLMVPVLIFIMILTNNKKYMGEYKNSLFTNIWGWMVVGVLTSLIVMLFYETFWT